MNDLLRGRAVFGAGGALFEQVVIYLAVDYNNSIARLTGRRQCPRCGTLYNVSSHPPRVEGVCDLDGEALIVRDDDQDPDTFASHGKWWQLPFRWPLVEYCGSPEARVAPASNPPPSTMTALPSCVSVG